MRMIWNLFKLTVLLAVLGLVFHNFTARLALVTGLHLALGVPVEVDRAEVDLLNTKITFEGIRIKNPEDYPRAYLALIPRLAVDFELPMPGGSRFHIDRVDLEIDELRLFQLAGGRFNLLELRPLQRKKTAYDEDSGKKAPGLPIHELVFSLRRMEYVDLSSGVERRRGINMNINRALYENVGSAGGIIELVAWEAMKSFGFQSLLPDLGIRKLGLGGSGLLDRAFAAVRGEL